MSAVTRTRCHLHTYRSDRCALHVTLELASGTDATSSMCSTKKSRLFSVQRQIYAVESFLKFLMQLMGHSVWVKVVDCRCESHITVMH